MGDTVPGLLSRSSKLEIGAMENIVGVLQEMQYLSVNGFSVLYKLMNNI